MLQDCTPLEGERKEDPIRDRTIQTCNTHNAHGSQVIDKLALSCPKEVVAGGLMSRVPIHKLQLQTCLWLFRGTNGSRSVPTRGWEDGLVTVAVDDLALERCVLPGLVGPFLLRLKRQETSWGGKQPCGKHIVGEKAL